MRQETKHTDLRFNIDTETQFSSVDDLLQIKFGDGSWITVGPDLDDPEGPEPPQDIKKRLEDLIASTEHASLWIPLDLIKYDSTGRCQQIQFHYRHQGLDFQTACEKFHNPRSFFIKKAKGGAE